jgi:M6 family metalloprotease-like protein
MQKSSVLRIATALITLVVASGYGRAQVSATSAGGYSTLATTSIAEKMEVEGTLEVRVEDYERYSKTRYFLNAPGGRIPLHFNRNPPTNFLSGAQVRVSGTQRPDNSLMLESGSTSVQTLSAPVSGAKAVTPSGSPSAAPLPNTFGAQSTLVMLVNFQDAPGNQPYTVASAQSVVFGTGSAFFLENSYQQTWLTGQVVGWFTVPLSSTSCNTTSIASYADAAASAAGVNLSAYAHHVYAFPQNNACGWAGLSIIGGSPSQSWINGTNSSASLDVHTVDHELGHGLGLWHSHLLDCGTNATIGSNCAIEEYGDILDTMGAVQGSSPHYNAFQKERLGWLNAGASPSITTVQTSGTYTLETYELAGAGPNAIKILKSTDPTTGAKTWYYVEARQAVGFDAFMANASSENETNGVLVHIGTEGNGNTGDLLDMTPATPSYYWWFDPSIAVAQTFADPTAGVTITTAWVTSNEAAVSVQFGSNVQPTGTVAVAVATSQPSYSRSQTVSITATVTVGGSPVANDSVKFTITKANGAVVSGTAMTKTNGNAGYNLKLKRSDPVGTYQVNVTTTINAVSSSAATSFTVL